jgi:hypothetical protein
LIQQDEGNDLGLIGPRKSWEAVMSVNCLRDEQAVDVSISDKILVRCRLMPFLGEFWDILGVPFFAIHCKPLQSMVLAHPKPTLPGQ